MTASAPSAERLARVVLNAVAEPGQLRMCQLVAELGAQEVLASLRDQRLGSVGEDLAGRLAGVDAERLLESAQGRGIRFVVPGDAEWPRALDDLVFAPPLHDRGGPPVGLWVRGPGNLAGATVRAVSVVGSRSATSYGGDVAGDVGAGLARAGVSVVSGAAFGIDQAAHRGALAARGTTIAVLACGVDRAYPVAHAELLRYIAETGLLVSEAPLGGAPMRVRFLARNRLIAGLSQGTVLIEAAVRSGALNSASWAGGLGRVVMGVPGPVTSATSEGVHQLIRGKDGLLVTNVAEVLEAVAPAGDHLLAERRGTTRPGDLLTPIQRQVLDAVPVGRPAAVASIARTAGLAQARTSAAIRRLEEVGLAERDGAGWRLTAGVDTP